MNPLIQIALRSILSRSPPRFSCAKKTKGPRRQPEDRPLGGKEPKPVPTSLCSLQNPQSIPRRAPTKSWSGQQWKDN